MSMSSAFDTSFDATTIPPVPSHPIIEPYCGIVTFDEFWRYEGMPNWNPMQKQNVIDVLKGTQQDLENYLNRPLELLQIREAGQADANGILYTTVAPVRKIIKVESTLGTSFSVPGYGYTIVPEVMERDALILPDDPRLVQDNLYPVVGDPQLVPGGVYVGDYLWGGCPVQDWYAVEYIGGYNGYVDQGVKLAIMQVAARSVDRNHDTTLNLRGGDAQQANSADERPKGWTLEEKQQWDRLKRRVAV